ncbi:MAG: ATP-binding cassette domain-containing protein [Desulfosoma sp.]
MSHGVVLEARNLVKSYPHRGMVLSEVSLRLGRDDTYAVVGPSGCGKSTLLYLLCGLTRPDAGTVMYEGHPVDRPRRDIAVVLQDYGLLPWKTVWDNVILGLTIQGVSRAERTRRASVWLQILGLKGRERCFPAQLSGGEQQRVALARALAAEPGVLLLDEPFSSLDAITRERLQHTLLDMWQSVRVPYVLVTHSVDEAVFLGRKICVMAGNPARFVTVVDNPYFGNARGRKNPAFYSLVQQVRAALDHAVPGDGAS